MKFQDFEQQLVQEGLLEIEPETTADDILNDLGNTKVVFK